MKRDINIEVIHTMLFKYTETMAEVGTEEFDILLENNLQPLKELEKTIEDLKDDISYEDYDGPTHGGFSGQTKIIRKIDKMKRGR